MMRLGPVVAMACTFVLAVGQAQARESSSCPALQHFCAASDDNRAVVEPILTRSSLAPVTTDEASLAPNRLANANITSFSISAAAGQIRASLTTLGPIVHD